MRVTFKKKEDKRKAVAYLFTAYLHGEKEALSVKLDDGGQVVFWPNGVVSRQSLFNIDNDNPAHVFYEGDTITITLGDTDDA